jgi:hypothetical protein
MGFLGRDFRGRSQSHAAASKRIVALAVLAGCIGLAACAGNPISQVKEIHPGVYSLAYAPKSDTEAIRKAGEYCHAKGQQLSILPDADDYEVRFRCVAVE